MNTNVSSFNYCPEIAVIIPTYKQPGFLAEAIQSVLTSHNSTGIGIVIVNDGCPFPQTHSVALSFSRQYPASIIYLRQKNGGLSAARNTGIDLALTGWPSCRAVYPLDSDNRIRPDFLKRALAALDRSPENIGWVYPDIDLFGFDDNFSSAGEYSYFLHLMENYCEAGSLIRREVFECGLRYQESMRFGFEDWDFWIRCAQAGFRGTFLPAAGFQYRKRAESMLAGSERLRPFILGEMRIRYAKHLAVKQLLRLEAEEIPRFALFRTGEKTVDYIVDPMVSAKQSEQLSEAQIRFVEARRHPKAIFFPPFCCFGTPETLDLLGKVGLLRNIFYHAQLAMRDAHFVAVTVKSGATGQIGLNVILTQATGDVGGTAVLMFARTDLLEEVALDPYRDWVNSIRSEKPHPKLVQIAVQLPAERFDLTLPFVVSSALSEIDGLRDRMLSRSVLSAFWRDDVRRPRRTIDEAYLELAKCGVPFPHLAPDDRRDIGFVLPLFSFGGVEKVVFNYAAAMRSLGWRPHLFITGAMHIQLMDDHFSVFESVNFFQDGGIEGGNYDRLHLGAGISAFGEGGDTRDAVGLLATMDVVLNTHALGGHALMASLRQHGVKTWLGLHLVERANLGHPAGNPHIGLAYEGAYDGFLVISDQLRSWCIGQAVPADKIVKIENAPSYPCDPAVLTMALTDRSKAEERPLRVLYLGRLDPQKGLDRLRDIIMQTADTRFAWRVIGKTVLQDGSLDLTATGVTLEPPAMTGVALDSLYAWADVVVLPSRFEGVPLTILEAQRFGCVMVATDVGAVSEIIRDGEDGFLISGAESEFGIVARFVSILEQLSVDRARLRTVGMAAAARAAESSWRQNMQEWLVRLELSMKPAA